MNILSPQLGLSPKSILGGEVFDVEILTGLARKGAKVEVLLPKNLKHPIERNLKIKTFPLVHFPAICFNLLIIPYVLTLKNDKKPQIFRLHQPQFMFIPAILIKCLNNNFKVVATYHQFKESNFHFLSSFLNNKWDLIVCDSFAVKAKLIKRYQIDQSKILVVHNGTPKYLKPQPKDTALTQKLQLDGKKVLLFMGSFIPRKNPLFLLRLVKQLNKKNKKFVVIFLGKGPLLAKIQSLANELSVTDQIRIIEPVYGAEKLKIHNLADIFVHPALDEGFALAPLEAMACAKPVIMNHGYSSHEAVKNGHNGYLCKTNSIKSWGDAILKITSSSTRQTKMGLHSLEKAKKEFSWKESIDQHYVSFKKLLS